MIISEMIAGLADRESPPMVILDVTNVCNLKCIHCPQPSIQSAPGFTAAHMSRHVFAAVLDDLKRVEAPSLLRFVGDGEPLLHPDAVAMLIRARAETSCVINVTTNGTRLTSDVGRQLLEARVHMIDVSIDAFTKPTYERVRRNGRFELVLANLFTLLELKKQLRADTKILVSFIRQAENEAEENAFRAFWEPLVDFVSIRALHSANNRVKVGESVARSAVMSTTRFPCAHLWKRLVVDFAGRIKFCPTDWGKGSVIGHALEGGLRAAWAKVGELRLRHLQGAIPAASICGPCTDWATTPWDRGYERIVDALVFGRDALCPGLPLLDLAGLSQAPLSSFGGVS
jgi:sulfatase maturation enzyme AslB (radical SAM superfamily)